MIEVTGNLNPQHNRRGLALVVVLVMLIVLSALAYTLTLKVWAYKKRSQYMIDYQQARYGCDSAVKYALATLRDINEPVPIARPNEPDFSDLFVMDEQQRRELLKAWAESISAEQARKYQKKVKDYLRATTYFDDLNDTNDFNNFSDFNGLDIPADFAVDSPNRIDPNNMQIPGPYGPPWPLIREPLRIMVGDAAVTIEIHDENAKYPIGWVMLDEPEIRRQVWAGFEMFCEWMDVNRPVIYDVEDQLAELNKIKEYKLNFKDITIRKSKRVRIPSRRRTRRSRARTRVVTQVSRIPADVHYSDFARLTHGSLLNTEALARPFIVTDDRRESALKYISLWPTNSININTAPRHVLEAAFAFGGLSDARPLAEAVIRRRKIEPYKDPNEIRRDLYRFADTIEKSRDYIVTQSRLFTIRVTADCGQASASAVIAVRRNKNKMEKIAVLSG